MILYPGVFMCKEKLIKFYSKAWEVSWAKNLDADWNVLSNVYNNRMLDALRLIKLPKNAGFSLLDVGCGIGVYSFGILKEFSNCNLKAFDLSKRQIEFATEEIKKFPFKKRAIFFTDDAEKFSLNETFDYIICTELLEHIPHPDSVLKRILLHSREDTRFIFSVPIIRGKSKAEWLYRQFTDGEKWIETPDFNKIDKNKEYYEFYHKQYIVKEIIDLLSKNHFTLVSVKYSNFKRPFKNKYLNCRYSIDKILNNVTFNKKASQITVLCKRG